MRTKRDKFFRDNKSGFSSTLINFSGYGYGRHCAGTVHLYGYDLNELTFEYIVTRNVINLSNGLAGSDFNIVTNNRHRHGNSKHKYSQDNFIKQRLATGDGYTHRPNQANWQGECSDT